MNLIWTAKEAAAKVRREARWRTKPGSVMAVAGDPPPDRPRLLVN